MLVEFQRWIVQPGNGGTCEGSHSGLSRQRSPQVFNTAQLQRAGKRIS